MIPPVFARRRSAPMLALLLALSLLLTQWLGYAHAIAHAGGNPEVAQWSAGGGALDHDKSANACAAFDAATLGAGLQGDSFPPLPAAEPDAPVVLPLRAGWHRHFTAHFSSRAPPLNA